MYSTSTSEPITVFYFVSSAQEAMLFDGVNALLSSCGYNVKKLTLHSDLSHIKADDLCLLNYANFSLDENIIGTLGINVRWVLIDAKKADIDEQQIITSGFDGVFYDQDSPDLFLKGMNVLREGDFWFSRQAINCALRKLLSRQVKQQNTQQTARVKQRAALSSLTKRERLIIEFVSVGAKNHEIADKLHISVNTVKTHIYSIFKKTNSRNRIELMSWSSEVL